MLKALSEGKYFLFRFFAFSVRKLFRNERFLLIFISSGNEDNTRNHKQEPKLSFLIKAIYSFAHGLEAYHEDVCGKEYDGVCPQLKKSFNHSTFFVR